MGKRRKNIYRPNKEGVDAWRRIDDRAIDLGMNRPWEVFNFGSYKHEKFVKDHGSKYASIRLACD